MGPGDVTVPVCRELAHTEAALSLARLSSQTLASAGSQKRENTNQGKANDGGLEPWVLK